MYPSICNEKGDRQMPNVSGKKYAYTTKGKAAAAKATAAMKKKKKKK
jgi:hypothetical protein